jgi:hypothetical protein
LEVALLELSVITARLLRVRFAVPWGILVLKGDLRWSFVDELFDSETLVHGMLAVAHKTSNIIRLCREGDGGEAFASGSAESDELVARPDNCTMKQRVQRLVGRLNKIIVEVLQEDPPRQTVRRFAHGGGTHELAKLANENGLLGTDDVIVRTDVRPECRKFFAIFLECSKSRWLA